MSGSDGWDGWIDTSQKWKIIDKDFPFKRGLSFLVQSACLHYTPWEPRFFCHSSGISETLTKRVSSLVCFYFISKGLTGFWLADCCIQNLEGDFPPSQLGMWFWGGGGVFGNVYLVLFAFAAWRNVFYRTFLPSLLLLPVSAPLWSLFNFYNIAGVLILGDWCVWAGNVKASVCERHSIIANGTSCSFHSMSQGIAGLAVENLHLFRWCRIGAGL